MVVCAVCGHEFDQVWRWCPACGALDRSVGWGPGWGDDAYVVDWAPADGPEVDLRHKPDRTAHLV